MPNVAIDVRPTVSSTNATVKAGYQTGSPPTVTSRLAIVASSGPSAKVLPSIQASSVRVAAPSPIGTSTSKERLVLFASDEFEEPVQVRVKWSDEGVVFEDTTTGIYGWGPSFGRAAADFRTALREHSEVLGAQPALSQALTRQLAYLRYHLGRSVQNKGGDDPSEG
jgi:hypothetical protein